MKNKSPNRKHQVLLAVILLCSQFCHTNAQTPEAQVYQEWTGTAGYQTFFQKSVTKTDASNNVFIAGASVNSSGDYDIMVAKYSPDGYMYWYNQYAGSASGNDFATALTIDGSGNVILTGSVLNDVSDSNDVITIKYNSSGIQQWATMYHGGTGSDVGTDIITDASGNIFVSGTTNQGSSTKFDALLLKYNSSGTQQFASIYNYNNLWDGAYRVVLLNGGKIGMISIVQNNSANYKLAVVKYNSNGSFSSATVTGNSGIGFTMVYSCVVDNQHNTYVTGCTNGTSSVDYYTIKLDSALNQLWTATYNGASNLTDEAKGIVVDASGNVYITGYSTTASQGNDMVTIKYNSGGTQQWVKIYNGAASSDDEANAIAIDASGNPVVCGASNNGDSYDYYTVKYDASANIKWEMTWNSAANRSDRALDIAVDQSGAIIVTGQSMTGPSTFTYVTVKYAEHSVLTPTDSEPLLHAFCFTENRGQLLDTDGKEIPEIKFYNRENAGRQQLYFTDDRLSYVFTRLDTSSTSPMDTLERIDMTFDGSNSDKLIYAMDKRSDYMNYFLGQFADPFARIANYDRLYHEEVYEGIDVMYVSNSRGLKYYYLISPNASMDALAEVYDGADTIYVDTNGDLVIAGILGTIRRPQPKVWEVTSAGSTVSLAWQPSYNVTGNIVTLTLGAYTAGNTLVIQVDFGNAPTIQQNPNDNLEWATHYGSQAGGDDPMNDTETDASGNSYFSGYTFGNNFPILNAVQIFPGGNSDGTILKFAPNASRLWATYIGGPGAEALYRIDVDTAGQVFFGGRCSSGIITVQLAGAFYDNTHNGGFDWHLGKISTNGSSLLWSTYYGGGGQDFLEDMKVTPTADRLYYVGNTGSSGWPICTKTGAYNTGTGNAVIIEFDSALDTTWSVRFGTGGAAILAIDGDMNDGFFLTGRVDANQTVPYVDPGGGAYYDTLPNGRDMFVACLNSNDTVMWCTAFGGGQTDIGWDILKTGKDVYVVGETNSNTSGFPILADFSAGEFKDSIVNQNNPDGFIARFSGGGIQKWTTYFGGANSDFCTSVIADKSRTIYVTGSTLSYDYYMQAYGSAYYQFPNIAYGEVFFASFSPANEILWSTGFGGSQFEGTGQLATFGNEHLYFCGNSNSVAANFPWDYPTGGWIDTLKSGTTPNTGYVGRFGIQNINVATSDVDLNGFGFQLFPNPTSDVTNLAVSGLYGDDIEIIVTDMLGRVVYTRKIDGVFGTLYEGIDTSTWESGVYLVSINTSRHGSSTKKLMKQ